MPTNKSRFSLAQLTYLEMIEKLEREGLKCSVTKVAALSLVTHGTVSRFFKTCQEQKLLDKENHLTEKGRCLLTEQKKLREEITRLVQELGFTGEEKERGIRNLMEDMEPTLLKRILEREERRKELALLCESGGKAGSVPARAVEELISFGTHIVEFRLFRLNGEGLSMADHGFEHPACIRKDETGVWFELSLRKMQGRSRKDGHMMTGLLETMRYESRGVLRDVEMKEEYIRIPLEAFQFVKEFQTEFTGTVYVTVTCTVGEEHMPENTARLVLWL